MGKRRRRRPRVPEDPIQQVLNDLFNNVQKTLVSGLRRALEPPPAVDIMAHINTPLQDNDAEPIKPYTPIKDVEVIAVRTEKP